jgi:hypothetical protein
MYYSERSILVLLYYRFSMINLLYTYATVVKAQQLEQEPWSLIGVTAPFSIQLREAGAPSLWGGGYAQTCASAGMSFSPPVSSEWEWGYFWVLGQSNRWIGWRRGWSRWSWRRRQCVGCIWLIGWGIIRDCRLWRMWGCTRGIGGTRRRG